MRDSDLRSSFRKALEQTGAMVVRREDWERRETALLQIVGLKWSLAEAQEIAREALRG